MIEGVQCITYRNHKKLKDLGGRPSREINPDPGVCPAFKSDIEKRYYVSDHWHGEAGRIGEETQRWLDFRWHQFKMREDSQKFNKYEEAVRKHRQEMSMDWAVELQLSRQTKLDEWREYYIYERKKRRALEKKLDQVTRKLKPAKERVMKAKCNGSVGVPPTALSKRWAELVDYEVKTSHARKEVDMAQKRLEVSRVEESLSPAAREALVTKAEEELESAQKRLKAEKSDELEQLGKEAERMNALEALEIAQGSVNYAKTCLEQLDTLLAWIKEQFAEIATEYASSSRRSKRALLESWEKYYVYMRERLQVERDRDAEWAQIGCARKRTEAEEARDDLLFPQERVRPLKALLMWMEGEFPTIAAEHASPGDDSQIDSYQWNESDPPRLKPSTKEPARKTSRKCTGREEESAKRRSPLRQVQLSKISKPGRGKKSSTIRQGIRLPEGRLDVVGHTAIQELPEVAVRRSQRIAQQTRDLVTPLPGPIRASKASSQRSSHSAVRRSARISNLAKQARSLELCRDVKPITPSKTARRGPTRRPTGHANSAYSGKPQGISKRSRRKAGPEER